MNKRKIILGILIVMAMAICGAFVTKTQPTVFASEMTVQQSEGIVTEAGTFYGQGYYEVGQTATLKADMNVGYAFDAWVAIDESNVETVLSTEEEYAFVVDGDITIEYRYHKIQYDVTFANDLWTDVGKTELKDFSYSIENNTQSDGNNYYNNEIEITLNIKNGTYIYNLLEENIIINGVSLDNIKSNNPMNVGATITNMDITGLSSVVITLNIQQDVEIDINYTYMYQLSIVSADEGIDVSELMQFITVSNHAGLLDEDNYIYLVRADKQVTITTLPGDDVYTFVTSQFQGNDPTTIASNSYMLYGNSIFTVTYVKVNYIIDFNTYLINLHGAKDLITILYNIADVGITAGDTIGFVYDDSTKAITITDRFGAEHFYEYPVDVFGYKFVGFAINNEILASSTYTLSST
ncbi:MAG: hypothetical protein J6Q15_02020, partial [Clostridia bacterium]|nr:hypothetical protein [Clostridia bacterium]